MMTITRVLKFWRATPSGLLQDVIPYLVRHQRTAPPLPLARADSAALVQSALVDGGAAGLPDYATSLSHGGGRGGGTRSASAYPGAMPCHAPGLDSCIHAVGTPCNSC